MTDIQEIEKIAFFAMEEGEGGLEIRYFRRDEDDEDEFERCRDEGWLTGMAWFDAKNRCHVIDAIDWLQEVKIFSMKVTLPSGYRRQALRVFFDAYKLLADEYANG